MKIHQNIKSLAIAAGFMLAAASANASCTVNTELILFGQYLAAQPTPLDTDFVVTYSCTNRNERFNVSFSAGGSGNTANRELRSGNSRLNYQLYTNAARTALIPNNGQRVYPGNPGSVDVTYYARIAALQDVTPGFYYDIMVINITP